MMDYKRAEEMVRGLTRDDGVLGYNPEQARLLLQVLRTLARGRPVTGPEIDAIAADLGWAPETAHAFLRPLTERDAADAIIGVLPGLSLGDHPHSFWVNGRRMSAWCAEDMLVLPALLGQTGTIESTSPLSREPVRLTVGPDGVRSVNPPGAVVSIPIVDPAIPPWGPSRRYGRRSAGTSTSSPRGRRRRGGPPGVAISQSSRRTRAISSDAS